MMKRDRSKDIAKRESGGERVRAIIMAHNVVLSISTKENLCLKYSLSLLQLALTIKIM